MKFTSFFVAVLLCAIVFGVSAQPIGLDFEDEEFVGWFKPPAIEDYAVKLTTNDPHGGNQCAEIASIAKDPDAFGNLMQYIDASPYRGKEFTFKAFVRSEAGVKGRAQLWFRVDRDNEKMGFFDNMNKRPITSPEWREYTISGTIDDDARGIAFGCMLIGTGKIYLDDVSMSVDGVEISKSSKSKKRRSEINTVAYEKPRPLTARGLENLTAFTKLYGYIRHFHPSDQVEAADWEGLAINGVKYVEQATDDEVLAVRLREFFAPIAPTVQITVGKPATGIGQADASAEATEIIYWNHHGVGIGEQSGFSVYSSRRERVKLSALEDNRNAALTSLYRSGRSVQKQLAGNVYATVPLMVLATKGGSIPASTTYANDTLPAGYVPSGDDRATRLADIVIAWNVFQHFYPYFDVVKTDWQQVLTTALNQAAQAKDVQEFEYVLKEMIAQLHDGHGSVWNENLKIESHPAPFETYIKGDRVIITDMLDKVKNKLNRGDVIEKINGKDIGDFLALRRKFNSSATPQFMDFMLGTNLFGRYYPYDTAQLTIRRNDVVETVSIKTAISPVRLNSTRPDPLAQLDNDIFYVDLGRIKESEFKAGIGRLEDAKAIIFDMRGYPADNLTMSIEHVIDKPVSSAKWNIPTPLYPDQEKMEWEESGWDVKPKSPRFTKNIVYLTDGRAVSAAETFMGIIEYYKLGEIVGSATAGTNGNINPFKLPGDYRIRWTGMKVLKHDGSQHHGIGILPTVPCEPSIEGIRAGRDEVLEKGIEVAKKMIERN